MSVSIKSAREIELMRAAGKILAHDSLSIVQGVLDPPPPEGVIKPVVGVPG